MHTAEGFSNVLVNGFSLALINEHMATNIFSNNFFYKRGLTYYFIHSTTTLMGNNCYFNFVDGPSVVTFKNHL